MGTGFSYGNELPVPCFFRKFISLFLVISLMMLSANLYAKESRGANLIITKKDGQKVEGELITVKEDSLLLLDTEGKDVSVDVVDIEHIRIVKKSKALLGAGVGLLIGGGIGTLSAVAITEDEDALGLNIIAFAVIFAPLGAWMGSSIGRDA